MLPLGAALALELPPGVALAVEVPLPGAEMLALAATLPEAPVEGAPVAAVLLLGSG